MPTLPVRFLVMMLMTLVLVSSASGQLPVGGIGGTVSDKSGAIVVAAAVTAANTDTGLSRSATTGQKGGYAIPQLPPGVYELGVEAEGFQNPRKRVVVQTGATTRVDVQLSVDILEQVVEAIDYLPELRYDWHGLDGVVSRFQIENLPLNGREFLQLSILEPGVMAAPRAGFFTRQFDVSVLGASPARTRYTMDGSPIHNPLVGGMPQNFSQEVVQEFQIQTVNFDLSTGLTGAGAVNVVTRSGGNDFHGSGFFLFRDHNLSAYPALGRDPTNPDPFFARRQWGLYVGGPIKKDCLFFFTNLEHNNQDGVFTIQPRSADFVKFGGIFPSPLDSTQVSARFDIRLSDKYMAFLRYSHDGNEGFAPPTGQGNLPSNWSSNSNWADQSVGSLSSAFRPNVINELRFAYWYWQSRNLRPDRSNCPGECIGLGMPEISILGSDFVAGNFALVPQGGDTRRYHLTDNVSWQKGRHQLRFGFEWQYERSAGFLAFVEPASMVLYSPEIVRLYNAEPRLPLEDRILLPDSFNTLDDVLQLPLVGFSVGFGDPTLPSTFRFDEARNDHLWRFYWQDTWRVLPRLTLNYGLSYFYHPDLANHDLSKPKYLEPLLGTEGLGATRRDRNNFGPLLGLAWNVSRDNRTVVRVGAGIYYELPLDALRVLERSTIGPQGTGRFVVNGSIIPNPIFGIPDVSLFEPLNFPNGPTNFRGSHVLQILPDIRSFLEEQLGDPSNTDLSVRNVEIFKQGAGIIARDFTTPYSDRQELSDLIAQMISELSAMHTRVRGGDNRKGQDQVGPASLGARLTRDASAGGYRVDHIYEVDPDYPEKRAPLARPEVNVAEGDLILQVNGVDTLSVSDIGVLLRNKSGRQVRLRVRDAVGEERDVIIKPITEGEERDRRYEEWEYTRRRMVDELGQGEIGYVHLRAMRSSDIAQWARMFYPVFDRKGLIIDVRHNRGGNIDSWILAKLLRRSWFYWKRRVGRPFWNMPYAFRGHMVVLCDERTASDGEAFAEGFKRLGLGKAIGTRTWGGEVWLSSRSFQLVDRGVATNGQVGVYSPEGEWLIEGYGVDPDIVVDNLPHATFNGDAQRTAQLKAAVEHLQRLIEEQPVDVPEHPQYPDKSFRNGAR